MNEKDKYTLNKIYAHLNSVLEYCAKYSCLEEFKENKMCVEACVFNLMQIGELAKMSLSEDLPLLKEELKKYID